MPVDFSVPLLAVPPPGLEVPNACFLNTSRDMDTEPRFTANGFVADAAAPAPAQSSGRKAVPAGGGSENIADHAAAPGHEFTPPAIGEVRQRLFRFVLANVGRNDREILSAIANSAPATRALLADPARLSTHLQSLADELGFLQPVQLNRLKSLARQSIVPAATVAPAHASQEEARPSPPTPSSPNAPVRDQNGFARELAVNGTDELADPAKLLENITYQVKRNGTVEYALDGKAIFTDHGENIVMVKGADEQEQAILAAILIAKEKFGGTFDLTGDAGFKRRAVEIMLKYRVDVRLKDPEQDAMRRALAGEAFPQPADAATRLPDQNTGSSQKRTIDPALSDDKSHHPVNMTKRGEAQAGPLQQTDRQTEAASAASLEQRKNPVTPTPAAAKPENMPPADRLAGRVLGFGAAPYGDKAGNKESFFVELENADARTHKVWGIDLERALLTAGATVGDYVALQNLGRQPVSVAKDRLDAAGNIVASERIDTYRNTWHAALMQRADVATPDQRLSRSTDTTSRQTDARPVPTLRQAPPSRSAAEAARNGEWFEVRAPGAATAYHATPQEAVANAEQRHVNEVFVVNADFQESVLRKRNGAWHSEPFASAPAAASAQARRANRTPAPASDEAPLATPALRSAASATLGTAAPQTSPRRARAARPRA